MTKRQHICDETCIVKEENDAVEYHWEIKIRNNPDRKTT